MAAHVNALAAAGGVPKVLSAATLPDAHDRARSHMNLAVATARFTSRSGRGQSFLTD